jgi:hypothetical protein
MEAGPQRRSKGGRRDGRDGGWPRGGTPTRAGDGRDGGWGWDDRDDGRGWGRAASAARKLVKP